MADPPPENPACIDRTWPGDAEMHPEGSRYEVIIQTGERRASARIRSPRLAHPFRAAFAAKQMILGWSSLPSSTNDSEKTSRGNV
jgi:hypothetical protein